MKKRSVHFRLIGGIITAVLVGIIFALAANFEYTRAVEAKKRAVSDTLNTLTADLSGVVKSYIFVGNGVRYYINLTPDFLTEDMDHLIDGLVGENDSVIRNFALLRDTTISYVYPYEPNKSGIGTDLLKIEDQRKPVEMVKNTGKTFVTGPVNLIEGGKGILIRMIIHAGGETGEAYWGQIAEVLSYDEITKKAKIEEYFKKNYLRIYEENLAVEAPLVLWSNRDTEIVGAIKKEIDFGQSKWILEAAPIEGWTGTTNIFYILIVLGIIASISCGMLVFNAIGKGELLEEKVAEKTKALEESMRELEAAQEQLVEHEKMASLGVLVSGVAHEINTPLGISISTASYLEDISKKNLEKVKSSTLSKGDFIEFIENLDSGIKILNMNLYRAADLVQNFKQIAVDQNVEYKTEFSVREYIEVVVKTLSHEIRKAGVEVNIIGDQNTRITSLPGAFSRFSRI